MTEQSEVEVEATERELKWLVGPSLHTGVRVKRSRSLTLFLAIRSRWATSPADRRPVARA